MDLTPPVTLMDLGSNNGGFTLLLRSGGLHVEKLLCVELNPNTFTRLRFNLERNFRNRYTAINCAICGDERKLTVGLGSGSAGDSIYRDNNDATRTYSVDGRTFNNVFEEVFGDAIVDTCKIDIEGAEFEIFGNDSASKISNCRYVLMEIHHEVDRDRREVLKKLADLGFAEIGGEEKNKPDHHYVHLFANQDLIDR